jgi:hypothetical protein
MCYDLHDDSGPLCPHLGLSHAAFDSAHSNRRCLALANAVRRRSQAAVLAVYSVRGAILARLPANLGRMQPAAGTRRLNRCAGVPIRGEEYIGSALGAHREYTASTMWQDVGKSARYGPVVAESLRVAGQGLAPGGGSCSACAGCDRARGGESACLAPAKCAQSSVSRALARDCPYCQRHDTVGEFWRWYYAASFANAE